MGVEIAACVAWILAAAVGIYLLTIRLADGGLRQPGTKVTRFPVTLLVSHPLLAVASLVVWVFYMVTARIEYAWAAFGALLVVALLGFTMLTRWLVGVGGRHARGAEQTFPAVAVVVHGGVAIMTFVLVFLSAVIVSRG